MPAAIIGISAKPKDDEDSTCTIPIDSLEQDGTPPEQGDSVSFSVDGTVQSIDGDNATIKITAVNGEPVGETDQDENAEDQDQGNGGGPSLASMRSQLGGSGPPPGMAGMT